MATRTNNPFARKRKEMLSWRPSHFALDDGKKHVQSSKNVTSSFPTRLKKETSIYPWEDQPFFTLKHGVLGERVREVKIGIEVVRQKSQ